MNDNKELISIEDLTNSLAEIKPNKDLATEYFQRVAEEKLLVKRKNSEFNQGKWFWNHLHPFEDKLENEIYKYPIPQGLKDLLTENEKKSSVSFFSTGSDRAIDRAQNYQNIINIYRKWIRANLMVENTKESLIVCIAQRSKEIMLENEITLEEKTKLEKLNKDLTEKALFGIQLLDKEKIRNNKLRKKISDNNEAFDIKLALLANSQKTPEILVEIAEAEAFRAQKQIILLEDELDSLQDSLKIYKDQAEHFSKALGNKTKTSDKKIDFLNNKIIQLKAEKNAEIIKFEDKKKEVDVLKEEKDSLIIENEQYKTKIANLQKDVRLAHILSVSQGLVDYLPIPEKYQEAIKTSIQGLSTYSLYQSLPSFTYEISWMLIGVSFFYTLKRIYNWIKKAKKEVITQPTVIQVEVKKAEPLQKNRSEVAKRIPRANGKFTKK